jgi:hypothetical protein
LGPQVGLSTANPISAACSRHRGLTSHASGISTPVGFSVFALSFATLSANLLKYVA